jgi:hypothetical protein
VLVGLGRPPETLHNVSVQIRGAAKTVCLTAELGKCAKLGVRGLESACVPALTAVLGAPHTQAQEVTFARHIRVAHMESASWLLARRPAAVTKVGRAIRSLAPQALGPVQHT